MFRAIFRNAFQGCDYFVSDIFMLANVLMRSSLLVGLFVKDLVVNFWPSSSQGKDSDMIKQFYLFNGH